jgi:hypothetical protein
MQAEGWYRDPYDIHTDRWFSNGHATPLVRDDGVESHDPPPSSPYPEPLIVSPGTEASQGTDLKRADDPAEHRTYDAEDAAEAVMDTVAQSAPGNLLAWPSPRRPR